MEYFLSLDLGTYSTILIASTETKDKKFKILAKEEMLSEGMRGGVVNDRIKVQQTIELLLEKVTKTIRLEHGNAAKYKGQIIVGIAGRHTQAFKENFSSEVKHEAANYTLRYKDYEDFMFDFQKNLTSENHKLINIFPSRFRLNGEEYTNPVGMSGNKIEADFLVVTGETQAMQNIINCCKAQDLGRVYFLLEPLASSYTSINKKEKEKGVMLIDIGGGTTDIALFKDGMICHSAIFPIGGDNVTLDIKSKFNTTYEVAQQLKHKYGNAFMDATEENQIIDTAEIDKDSRTQIATYDLSKVVFSRYYEMAYFANYQIKKSGVSKNQIDKVVITGGGSLQKNAQHFFEYFLSLPTRKAVNYGEGFENFGEEFMSPQYSTILGLIAEHYNEEYVKLDVSETNEPEKEPVEPASQTTFRTKSNVLGFFQKRVSPVRESIKGFSDFFEDK